MNSTEPPLLPRQATAEQSAEYCRRRRRVPLLYGATFAGAVASVFISEVLLGGGRTGLAVTLIAGLGVVVALAIISTTTDICPACRMTFTRQHRLGRCEHCGAVFEKMQG